MIWLGSTLLVGAFVLSVALVAAARSAAWRIGFLDRPGGDRKLHGRAIPYGGGVAIFVTVAGVLLTGLALAKGWLPSRWLPGDLADFVNDNRAGLTERAPQVLSLLAGGLVLVILGVFDDRKALSPWFKLIVQTLVAAAMVAMGHHVTVFVNAPYVGWVLTVFWIVGITNAFNFLDNMDGLSAGVALVISLIFATAAFACGHPFVGAALVVLAASVAGFLVFNWYPASIFMGDAGSLFLGFTLSVLAVDNTFYAGAGTRWYVIVLPLILFAVPIYDVASVSLIRIRRGQSPFQGDRSHLSHRLVERGFSTPVAVSLICLITYATAGTALPLAVVPLMGPAMGAVFALLQTLAVVGVLAMIEYARGKGKG